MACQHDDDCNCIDYVQVEAAALSERLERDAALARAEKLESALRGFTEYFGAIADGEYPNSRPGPLRTMEQVLLDRARAAMAKGQGGEEGK